MSFYTNAIHTIQINPTSNSTNFRTEFRLNAPNTVYLTNIRICNVGVTTNTGTHPINSLAGLGSIIRNLTLYDGNVVLDQILNYNIWSAFNSYNKTNDDNISLYTDLTKNNLAFLSKNLMNATEIVKITNRDHTATDDIDTTPKAWISLKDVLAFLDQSQNLPTAIYKDLRLVIEYETDITKIFPNSSGGKNTIEPFLVVDELTNPEVVESIVKNYNGVIFQPVEHTRVVVPALNPVTADKNIKQNITYTLNSFNNKTLNRLLVCKTGSTNVSNQYGKLGSEHQFNESVQVNVNGANLLTGNGLTTDQERSAMLYDLWGDAVALCPSGGVGDNSNMIENAEAVAGRTDYTSVLVQNFVSDFQYSFGRTSQYKDGVADNLQKNERYNQQLQLNMFGEVNKSVVVNNGDYSIRYL